MDSVIITLVYFLIEGIITSCAGMLQKKCRCANVVRELTLIPGKKMKYLFIALALFSLTSCATIKNGKYQQVAFNSDPPGANIWVNNQLMGTTPSYVCLNRATAYMVRIDLNGYKPYQAQLVPTVSGWVFGNIVFGGVIGVAVDAVTGSMYKLTPGQLNVCLMAEDCQVIQNSDECKVVVLSKADPAWEQIGTLEKA